MIMNNNNKKYLFLDSRARSYGNSNKFRYQLQNEIKINEYISLHLFVMPRSNYLINQNNNTFVINFNNGQIVNVILLQQNYSPSDLVAYINSIVNINNFVCNYNQQTYKITFSANQNFTLDFTGSKFYRLLSLDSKIYSSTNNMFISNVINFNIPYYVNLAFENLTQNNVYNNNNYVQNVSFLIPINTINFSDILTYKDRKYKIKINDKISYLDVLLTDDFNQLYDNSNIDWYAVLEFV